MTVLRSGISALTRVIPVDAPLSNPSYPIFYDLDLETIKVIDGADTTEWQVDRGIADTQQARHAKSVRLVANASPYGGGGGGVPDPSGAPDGQGLLTASGAYALATPSASNTQYDDPGGEFGTVQEALEAVRKATVSDTAPSDPQDGDIWVRTIVGPDAQTLWVLFVRSGSVWIKPTLAFIDNADKVRGQVLYQGQGAGEHFEIKGYDAAGNTRNDVSMFDTGMALAHAGSDGVYVAQVVVGASIESQVQISGGVGADAVSVVFDGTGVGLGGSGTGMAVGFNGEAPVAQATPIADATDEASAIVSLNLLLAYLRTRGDIDT